MKTAVVRALVLVGACMPTTPALREVVLTTPANDPAPPRDQQFAPPFGGAARSGKAGPFDHALHIVTFNVHRRPGSSIVRAFRTDPALRDADLIVLTEIRGDDPSCSAACVAARELGMYAAYEPDWYGGSWSLGQAILSRVPFDSVRVIELPRYLERNAALAATIEVDGAPIAIYAVHLTDQLALAQRMTQMKPVLEDARAATSPVIIAGDFNTPANFVAHVLPIHDGRAEARFEAYVRSYGLDTPVAASGATFRVLPLKLDAIYTRGFSTDKFGTARGADVSDHLALWADMRSTTYVEREHDNSATRDPFLYRRRRSH